MHIPLFRKSSSWLFLLATVALFTGFFAEWSMLSRQMSRTDPIGGIGWPHPALRKIDPRTKPYEFPSGGRTLAGAYRIVALYGSPDSPSLGVLGAQPIPASIDRVKNIAASYRALSTEPILPTFEIVATVASASPTENNDYSREADAKTLLTWAQQAQEAGVYIVLDMQPGRSNFLDQAKQYESILRLPNVGLALDPEWRIGPNQIPLEQIGSVSSYEVNEVSQWLAAVTKQYRLPQKLFVLHQFRLTMLPDRDAIDTDHSELAYIIQMDGQGTQQAKQSTWQAIMAHPLPGAEFGWKNFYQQDIPMLDPAATMSITPKPWYISYQ